MQKSRDSIVYRARYSILGAMIGDALGTTLEFSTTTKAQKILDNYSNFKDGLIGLGQFNLVPGQFTDDTEMALAIMSVIISAGKYDQTLVSRAYRYWYLSDPFDIGRTTQQAVSQKSMDAMLKAAVMYNSESLSNGFLMRLFGLVGLYYDKSREELLNSIVLDVKLTHGHPEAPYIAMIYGLLLYNAINGLSANDIYLLGRKKCKHSPLVKTIYDAVDNGRDYFVYHNHKYLLSQIDSQMIGFVGYAFWLLLLSLKKYKSYEMAIINTVRRGGDTDTNACIVGAVMGALYPDTIPILWIKSVTTFIDENRFRNYPIANPMIWVKWLP